MNTMKDITAALAVGARLRTMIPEATLSERAIICYLLEHSNRAVEIRLTELSSRFNVSQALVVKLCKKLGYPGFKDLRRDLQRYAQSSRREWAEEIDIGDSPSDILNKIFETSIQALHETIAVIDANQFELAVDLFGNAEFHDIYGVGGSASIAKDISHRFLRIGVKCNVYDDSNMTRMAASVVNEQSCIIAISHSGSTRTTTEAARVAKSFGASIIAVTSYPNSPLGRLADATLTSTARDSPFTGENAGARIAQLSILDALFVTYAFRNYENAKIMLNRTISAIGGKDK